MDCARRWALNRCILLYAVVASLLLIGCVTILPDGIIGGRYSDMSASTSWFHENALARELSQLEAKELSKFTNSDLLDVRPVILPEPEYVVGENDYFMWPIATMVEGRIVVLYQRTSCHWGPDIEKRDILTGIRMIVTSDDAGLTWSRPADLFTTGMWSRSPFWGFGGGIGVHNGIVYVALNKGIYRSGNRGDTWELVSLNPDFTNVPDVVWAPGMRITFDEIHGLIIWTTSGFSRDSSARRDRGEYGTHLVALYSPDFGTTWKYESQPLPDGLRLSEVTPIEFDGQIAFFLRNGLSNTYFGQGFSATGWFPFEFALTNVGPVRTVDTPDVNYNPVTQRLEAAGPHRRGGGPGPQGAMKVNLYSISVDEIATGKTEWRYDGTLIRYRELFGKSDGFNVVGSVVDEERGKKFFYVWGGDCTGKAGIFQYSVSLVTPAVTRRLIEFYEGEE